MSFTVASLAFFLRPPSLRAGDGQSIRRERERGQRQFSPSPLNVPILIRRGARAMRQEKVQVYKSRPNGEYKVAKVHVGQGT